MNVALRWIALLPALALACSSSSSSEPAATRGQVDADAGDSDAGAGSSSDAASDGAAAGDTWNAYGKAFFATYCVECHAAGNASRDYTTLVDVKRDRDEIRCGVSATKLPQCGSSPPPSQFPIANAAGDNPKPSAAERARLVAWLEAGLP